MILIIMLLSFSACGTEKTPENTPQTTENPQQTLENEVIEMSFKDKVLKYIDTDFVSECVDTIVQHLLYQET